MESNELISAAQKELCPNRKHKSILTVGFKEVLAKHPRSWKSKLYGKNNSARR